MFTNLLQLIWLKFVKKTPPFGFFINRTIAVNFSDGFPNSSDKNQSTHPDLSDENWSTPWIL